MDEPSAARRRVLLIAYHFGPACATGGLRWNAMTTALVERGWIFDVVTLARDAAPAPGPHMWSPGVRVFPVTRPTWPDRSLKTLARAKRALQRNGASSSTPPVVDPTSVRTWEADRRDTYTRVMVNVTAVRDATADFGWSSRALDAGRALMSQQAYGAVVVSSPPHLLHRVGVVLSRERQVPFLADFRDPWMFGMLEQPMWSRFDRWLASYFEREVFDEARVLICNTEWSRRAAERHAAGRPVRTIAVPNGYDPVDSIDQPDATTFRVTFTGWLYPYMDPRPLLAACGRLRARGGRGADALSVDFVGTAADFGSVPLVSLAKAAGLDGCFHLHTGTSRDGALRFQQSAAVTTAFDYPHTLAVPMKFYDQAQMRGFMLLIGNPRGALADAASRLGLRVYAPTDAAGIDAALAAALQKWERRDYAQPLDAAGVFDRRHAVEQMHELLEETAAVR